MATHGAGNLVPAPYMHTARLAFKSPGRLETYSAAARHASARSRFVGHDGSSG
jgi:hypothetical protein